MLAVGSTVTVEVERPAVGGAMLARHEGEAIFVGGVIPGEVVKVRVHARSRGVAQATVVDILAASADRVAVTDPACGGRDYAHIGRHRQRTLKREQVVDAMRRIAKRPEIVVRETSGDDGSAFRLRARLHWDGTRVGFLRTGTHVACEEGIAQQFSRPVIEVLARVADALARLRAPALSFDLAENVAATERALHLSVPGAMAEALATHIGSWADVEGAALVAEPAGRSITVGRPMVFDEWVALGVGASRAGGGSLGLQRHPHAFFQGHRKLVPRLVSEVVTRVDTPRVADLYSGVGLFGLALAMQGASDVWCVEGDAVSGADLAANAAPFGDRVQVSAASVERWVAGRRLPPDTTVVLDPPRTGLSKEALEGIAHAAPSAVVYVSCDPATFARDVGRLAAHGYVTGEVQPLDLFPDTGHVEVVAALRRPSHA